MGWFQLAIVATVVNAVVFFLDRNVDTVFASVMLSLLTLVAIGMAGERRG